MKKIFLLVVSLLVVFATVAEAQKKEKPQKPQKHKELKTQLDTVSYALGMAIGNTIKTGGLSDINQDLFSKALKQSLTEGEETWIKKDTVEMIITNYLKKVEGQKGTKNLAEAKKFLEENKKKPGVIETASGLQYKIIKEGTGPKPLISDKVTVHYHGTLTNGKVFDSSVDRGEPIQLEVGRVIKGWTEALQMMPTGSKWVLYIHPDLGYGNRSMPGSIIEANSLLIFEVELISIEQPQPQAQPDQPAFQDMLNK
jgi:FKBP-type peptidyl-prolyl cis-trans isomerase FklB